MGLEPDGDRALARRRAPARPSNVVDAAWAAVDWTLGRAARTARFWWIALGYFLGLFAWYAVQVHQTKYLIEIGFRPTRRGVGARRREPGRHPGPDRARLALGPHRARVGVDGGRARLRDLLRGPAAARRLPHPAAALRDGGVAGHARLRPHLGGGRDPGRDLPGPALRLDLRHADALLDRGRRGRARGSPACCTTTPATTSLAFQIAIACSVVSAVAIWLAAPRKVRAVAGRLRARA